MKDKFINEMEDEWIRGPYPGEVICGGRIFRMTEDGRCEDKFTDMLNTNWRRDDDPRSAMPVFVKQAVRALWGRWSVTTKLLKINLCFLLLACPCSQTESTACERMDTCLHRAGEKKEICQPPH